MVLVFAAALLPTRASDLVTYTLIHGGLVVACATVVRGFTSRGRAVSLEGSAATLRRDNIGPVACLLPLAGLVAAGILLLPSPYELEPWATVPVLGLLLAVVAAAIAGIVGFFRWLRSLTRGECGSAAGRESLKFRLPDLFLAMGYVGAGSAIVPAVRCMGFAFRTLISWHVLR